MVFYHQNFGELLHVHHLTALVELMFLQYPLLSVQLFLVRPFLEHQFLQQPPVLFLLLLT
jgi:hypothetical protein